LADNQSSNNAKRSAFLNKVSESFPIRAIAELSEKDIQGFVNAYLDESQAFPTSKNGTLRIIETHLSNPDDLTHGSFKAISESDLVLADDTISKAILDIVSGDLMIIPTQSKSKGLSESSIFAAIRSLELGQDVVRLRSNHVSFNSEEDLELKLFQDKGNFVCR
jgi:hypothetical protein